MIKAGSNWLVLGLFLLVAGLPCAHAQNEPESHNLTLRRTTGYVEFAAGGIVTPVKNGANIGLAGGLDFGLSKRLARISHKVP